MNTRQYKSGVRNVFDGAAATYDRAGVEFFTPMGERLVELVAPRPGCRVLDVGCGRGASLFPAAGAVGPAGHVVGIDIAPAMIEETRRETVRQRAGNVELHVMDAERPRFATGTFDYVIGSFSVIFLADSSGALNGFHRLLRTNGRLGFTSPVFTPDTVPFLPPLFTGIITEDVLRHVPDEWHPRRVVERYYGWLLDPDELVATLTAVGFGDVQVRDEPVRMTTESGRDWVAWSYTQGMRLLWNSLPDQRRRELEAAIAAELEARRSSTGSIEIDMPVRYVVADARP